MREKDTTHMESIWIERNELELRKERYIISDRLDSDFTFPSI